MRTLRRFWYRLTGSLVGSRRDADLSRELLSHIDMQADEFMREGMPPEDARRAARVKFGSLENVKESYRDQRGLPQLDLLFQDLRYALRQFYRKPGFSVVVVLTLALAIGANTAVFSVMNTVILRSLPVPNPQQLVYLNTTLSFGAESGDGDTSLTEYIFEQLRDQRQVFQDVVAFAPLNNSRIAIRYGAEPEEAYVELVSGTFFNGLGVAPSIGRTFRSEDESAHTSMAVLSYDYWTRRTGGDMGILGRVIDIRGVAFTVVGVAARGFTGVDHGRATDVWIPLQTNPDLLPWGQPAGSGLGVYESAHLWWCLKTIGRLQPGMTEQHALARLQPVFQHAALDGSKRNPNFEKPKLYFTPARGIDGLRDEYKLPLQALMLMVGLVLVIACANIAMLLIARNAARQREFGLRMALGGGRGQFFRQLLTESLLLVGAGGLLGLVFAYWATRALAAWAALDVSLTPDRTVLLFTISLTSLAALVFGLAPLRSVIRTPIGLALKTSAATAFQGNTRRGQIIVALQTAMCLGLLVTAGLLLQTLRNLQNVNLGIRAEGLLVFGVTPSGTSSDAEALRFYRGLLDRMRAMPGVEGATLTRQRLGSGWSSNTSVAVDGADPTGTGNSHMRWNSVGPLFFHVMGTPVLMGRDFTDADTDTAPRVVIVNRTFVDQYLKGRAPLGRQVTRGNNPPCTIVGVVEDSKYTGVHEEHMPMAWFPYTQFEGITGMNVELRTAGNPAALLPQARGEMRQFAPGVALLQPMTQKAQFERSYSQERLMARLAMFFGLLAALLVATGLYGTLSHNTSRRTTEFGVRMALGARRGQVLWMVLGRSLVVGTIGIAAGVPLAIAGARLVQSMLFGVKSGDVTIFAAAIAGVIVVTLAASLIPARRAATIDPIVALRME
jgi:predicted permease